MRRIASFLLLGFLFALPLGCGQTPSPEPLVDSATMSVSALVELGIADEARERLAIESLRERGPEALEQILARHAKEQDPDVKERLEALADQVAAQKDAVHAGLFWHLDLAAAREESARRQVPILSLRLLGDLREEFSCANSRMFRAVLYADPVVAEHLREKFVLHWSSERQVPQMTIDMGDGRRIRRTITGNSAHYVLDAEGRPIDVLPGLYAPDAFIERLRDAEHLHATLSGIAEVEERSLEFREHHRAARQRAGERLHDALSSREVFVPRSSVDALIDGREAPLRPSAAEAMPRTIAKAAMETRLLPNPSREEELPAEPVRIDEATWAALAGPAATLSPNTRAFVKEQDPLAWSEAPADLEPMFGRLGELVATDSFRNEALYHARIHGWLAADRNWDFAALNERIYAELFLTPSDDPWLGLLDTTTFVGLEGGGVTANRLNPIARGLALRARFDQIQPL